MPKQKLNKTKLELVSANKLPAGIVFEDSSRKTRSVYVEKITTALADGSYICVLAADTYVKTQLQQAAKKLKVRLAYGHHGENVYIRVIQLSDQQKRLCLWLREPRTLNDLRAQKLELDIEAEVERLVLEGSVSSKDGKYRLTEHGAKAYL